MRWVAYLICALVGAVTAYFVVDKIGKKVEKNFEVIMFSTSLCDYCSLFEQEIGKEYESHSLAAKAPLIRVNIDEYGTGPYHLKKPLRYAPTFVIMKGDEEVGRIRGHMDKFIFLTFVRDHVYPPERFALSSLLP